MKKEWLKIGAACFVGAVVCFLLCVFLAPAFKFFGALAGLMAGYVAYEFRDFLRAIPRAFRIALGGLVFAWDWLVKKAALAKECLKQPRPRSHMIGLLTILSIPWLYQLASFMFRPADLVMAIAPVFLGVAFACIVWMMLVLIFVELGAEYLGFCVEDDLVDDEDFIKQVSKGFEPVKITYGNCVRWFAFGLGVVCVGILKFLFATMWVWGITAIAAVAMFWCTFLVELVKIIHTYKRLLCAVDGTLGGLWAWVYLSSVTHALPEHLVIACIGGMVGAFLGIVNYELVSVRLWKLNGAPAQS